MGERALNSPVRRIDVLESVKSEVKACKDFRYFAGLCPLLCSALRSYGLLDYYDMSYPVRMYSLEKFFPLYTLDNAVEFGAKLDGYMYWWPHFKWDEEGGRMRFLNWLIEQYKDDETDLRTL